jgi:hypothetical protein
LLDISFKVSATLASSSNPIVAMHGSPKLANRVEGWSMLKCVVQLRLRIQHDAGMVPKHFSMITLSLIM